MLVYARFETLRTIRNPGFLFLVTVVPVALYVIGVRGISEGESIGGIPASAWYLASATAIGAIGAAITGSGARLAAERASGWNRQLRVTPLTETGWLVGRLLASVLIVVPVVVVVAILALVVGDVELDAGQWIGLTAATLFGSISMALIGLIVGCGVSVRSRSSRPGSRFRAACIPRRRVRPDRRSARRTEADRADLSVVPPRCACADRSRCGGVSRGSRRRALGSDRGVGRGGRRHSATNGVTRRERPS